MKKILLLTTCFLFLVTAGCSNNGDGDGNEYISPTPIVNTDPTCSRIVTIPDANFKAKLLAGGIETCVTLDGQTIVDTNGDGEIQVCEAENVGKLTIDQSDITSIQGILEFRNLQTLSFKYNDISQALDLTSLKRLVNVMLTNNAIPSLKVNGLNHLEYLACDGNTLQTLNVGSLPSLTTLLCEGNNITTLNIDGSNKLVNLRINQNNISTLNVSHLSNLQQLYVQDNLLTTLNLNGLAKLQDVNCSANNLQSLDARGCVRLWDLECGQNNLTDLKLSGCTNLTNFGCSINNLITLDFQGLSSLSYVDCSGNRFVTLDIRDCVVMNYFDVKFNPNLQSLIVKNGSAAPQGIDIYQCPSLSTICCDAVEQAEIMSDVQAMGYTCNVVTNCF